MRLNQAYVVLAWLVLVLAGCSGLSLVHQATVPPTELVPTWIAQTVAARLQTEAAANAVLPATPDPSSPLPVTAVSPSATAAPTATLSVLGPSPTPTLTFTPTPTPVPVLPTRTLTPLPTASIPLAAIQFRSPGPLSRLVSPLHVQASVRPGPDGRVRVELLGEDGRLLVRQILNYGDQNGHVYIDAELPFEIGAAAETARLVISTYDSFSRLNTLATIEVILLSLGEDDINPNGNDQEAVIVLEPLPNKLIQGGVIVVNGLARLADDHPLLIELVTAQGKVVGYRLAGVTVDPLGQYTPFNAEVPYQVVGPTWVRLIIKQESSSRIPGLVYATSLEILLSP